MSRSAGAFLMFLAAALALGAGCRDNVTGSNEKKYHAEAAFGYEVSVGSRVVFSLQGVNGTVRIEGVSGATSVSITGMRRVESRTQSDADAHIDSIRVRVDSSETEVSARTDQPDDSDARTYIVDYMISVPLDLPIDIDHINGELTLDSLHAGVDMGTENGTIVAGLIRGNARMGVANGSIDVRVAPPEEGSITLEVANGTIDLEIPAATSAEFSASAANGTVSVAGLTLSGGQVTPQSVTGTLGGGSGTIFLAAANGTIAVRGY